MMTNSPMTNSPILFSVPLVQAIVAGDKTQTRRLPRREVQPALGARGPSSGERMWRMREHNGHFAPPLPTSEALAAAGARPVGSILWVREAWAPGPAEGPTYLYRADGERDGQKWKPSIHMPRAASRISLLITGVQFERLQGISDDDIVAEGVVAAGFVAPGEDLVDAWAKGWDSINAAREKRLRPTTWALNPVVIAYTFEVR